MGYLRRGKWIRDEQFVRGRSEYVCEAIGASSMLSLIHRVVALARRILPTLESSEAETELVLVVLRMLNCRSCKKAVGFR